MSFSGTAVASVVVIECEGSPSEFVLLSDKQEQGAVCGWLFSGSQVSLLRISDAFRDDDTVFSSMLQSVLQDKNIFFARTDKASKSISICKNVDDIVIKQMQFDILDVVISASANKGKAQTNASDKDSGAFCACPSSSLTMALSLESQLAAAQAALTSQSSDLTELRQRCDQLLAKYAAAAVEKAAMRDNLLAAFCRVLNAKKARIRELLGDEGDDGSETDNGSGEETSKVSSACRHGGGNFKGSSCGGNFKGSSGGGNIKGSSGGVNFKGSSGGGNIKGSSGGGDSDDIKGDAGVGKIKGGGGGAKRKSPAPAATTSKKPAVRRTRSNTKQAARGGGSSGDDE